MKEGAPVQYSLRVGCVSLLFVLEAHKVIRNSGAPSEKVLAGHRMNGLAEISLATRRKHRIAAAVGAKVENGCFVFQGAIAPSFAPL